MRVAINAVDDINPTESSNYELVSLVGTIYATIIRLCNTIRGSSKIYDRLCLDFPEGVAEKVLQIAKLQDKTEKDPNAPILVLHQQLAAAIANELKSKDFNFTQHAAHVLLQITLNIFDSKKTSSAEPVKFRPLTEQLIRLAENLYIRSKPDLLQADATKLANWIKRRNPPSSLI